MKGVAGYRPRIPGESNGRPIGGSRGPRAVTFRSEKDVRRWVREATADPFWVEPTRGGTIGVPDVFVIERDGVWLELKHGECRDRRLLKWKPRAGQYLALRTLRNGGVKAGFLVGFGNRLYASTDTEEFRLGWTETQEETLPDARDPESWGSVLDTIISGCKA